MNTKEIKLAEYVHPEGVEVKVAATPFNIMMLIFLTLFVAVGVVLYNYIWEYSSRYIIEYSKENIAKLQDLFIEGAIIMTLCCIVYILLQYGLLYWVTGKDRKALRWNTDWKSWGFLVVKPLPLKYYRVILLAPFVLMGLLPFIHGLCTANSVCYFTGIFCIVASGADCYYFWKLRSFDGNDKIVDGKESLSATIIKTSY